MSRRPSYAADVRPGDKVMALSLWEPWASLMARGAKAIETRHWWTSYRGPLLICAAKRRVLGELMGHFKDDRFRDGLGLPAVVPHLRTRGEVELAERDGTLNFGKAVALVDLVDLRKVLPNNCDWLPASERPFGDFSMYRFGWITEGRRRLVPFPIKGRQGLFEVEMPEFGTFPESSSD